MGVGLSSEDETRILLKIRQDLQARIGLLEVEIEDLRSAIMEIDRQIVRQGFRQPKPMSVVVEPRPEEIVDEEDLSSVKSQSGMTLGTLLIEESKIVFEPVVGLTFVTSIPPFQSFLIERVLGNMKTTDEERVNKGEITLDEVLSYEVVTEGERIIKILISNYGDERHLREIQSGLRWTFDKMYDRLRQS